MILLDTNVVSEAMRPAPEHAVIQWLNSQAIETLYLSAGSLAELLVGIAALPDGRRKSGLGRALDEQAQLLFNERILSFDTAAARAYAGVIATARRVGRPIGHADAQIAAIAAAYRLAVATRDTSPFEAAGIPVINPWSV